VDGEAIPTPVIVGPSDLTETLIEAGLDKDDVVVVGPFRVLVDIKHEQKIKEEGADEEGDAAGDASEADESDSSDDDVASEQTEADVE
ncbi:MAG: hypothetical protein AAFY58_07215, partial [Planctomycetota bacterium]